MYVILYTFFRRIWIPNTVSWWAKIIPRQIDEPRCKNCAFMSAEFINRENKSKLTSNKHDGFKLLEIKVLHFQGCLCSLLRHLSADTVFALRFYFFLKLSFKNQRRLFSAVNL